MVAHSKIPFKIVNANETKIKVPRNMMISGQSGSGKTMFILKLITFANQMFDPVPKQIVYAYGHYNSAIPVLKKLGVVIHEGIPTKDFLNLIPKPMFLILDDLMLQLDKKYIEQLYTVDGHHEEISVAMLVQNAFDKNIKVARDNCHYLILLNSPAAKRQIRDLGVCLYPNKSKKFMDIYEKVTKEKYEPLLIDLDPGTDEDLRLRSHIFPDQITQIHTP